MALLKLAFSRLTMMVIMEQDKLEFSTFKGIKDRKYNSITSIEKDKEEKKRK